MVLITVLLVRSTQEVNLIIAVIFLWLHDVSFIYILFYVDDMLIAMKDVEKIEKVKTQLNQEYEMKDWVRQRKY